ncbi:thioesterase II family protein [Streptomyces sp. LaBMicrA B280]|uniref:thioesterase II family protein n=1 Tax=Streptomyces sp. LaBMicrA B280 TaxID=3391001 RepID=UPI003BA5D12A
MSTEHPVLKNLTPDRPVSLCTVVCFPYAGGGARVFRGWQRNLSRLVNAFAVQLPGREERLSEAPESDPERLVAELCAAIEPIATSKLVLFGHSLGAVLAARVAQELLGDRSESDAVLIVSGRRSPWSGPVSSETRWLADGELLERLGSEGGPRAELASNAEFARLMLPALKADLHLSDAAHGIRERAVRIPVIGLYGQHDEGTPPSYVRPWARFTTGGFRSVEIDGGHFFVETKSSDVIEIVDATARSLIGL